MPRKAVDYSNTIIYKIVCNDLNITDVYVGHTTDFTKRKNKHKSRCNNENDKNRNYKVYQIIRQNGGGDNWTMIETEKYCCKDGNEATARERYWYETLNGNMNNNVPNRSQKEYVKSNKEIIKERQQQYYLDTKEIKNEKFICECGGKYTTQNKSTHFKSKKHQNFIQKMNGNLPLEQSVEVEKLDLVC